LNALPKKACQKARNSAKGFAVRGRLFAGAGRDAEEAEEIVAMTRPLFLAHGLAGRTHVFSVEDEFSPDLLKDGFNCRDRARTWCRSRIHPW
jgi:hypothetical protein